MSNELYNVKEVQIVDNTEDVNIWLRTKKWVLISVYTICYTIETAPNNLTQIYTLGRIKD